MHKFFTIVSDVAGESHSSNAKKMAVPLAGANDSNLLEANYREVA